MGPASPPQCSHMSVKWPGVIPVGKPDGGDVYTALIYHTLTVRIEKLKIFNILPYSPLPSYKPAIYWSFLYQVTQSQKCCSWFKFQLLPYRCRLGCSTNSLINDWVNKWSFSSQSSRHPKSQTIRARELKFWENVHPPPCVTCYMSHVTCHMSHVRCQVSHVRCHMSGVACHL